MIASYISNKDNITRIEIELTDTCNLNCVLCSRETHPEFNTSEKYRGLKEIQDQLDQYKNLKYITIAGPRSEPTLYPHLFDLIKYLRDKDLEISLFINGDTKDNIYYGKLSLLFRTCKGSIYFTVCGSTQELHEKYRVGSSLEKVLEHFNIVHKLSNKAVLTWIVFNYNEQDFKDNYKKFSRYNTEYFYTLPVDEHFDLNTGINLPQELRKAYNKIDKTESNIKCPAEAYNFALISSDGSVNPCSLYKNFKEEHCFECGNNNAKILRENKIYHIAECEDETSEQELRI